MPDVGCLTISRKANESFTILLEDGRHITVTPTKLHSTRTEFRITAPKSIQIKRNELLPAGFPNIALDTIMPDGRPLAAHLADPVFPGNGNLTSVATAE